MELFVVLFYLFYVAIVCFILYWTIRLAVRHAIKDADRRRAKAAKEPPRP